MEIEVAKHNGGVVVRSTEIAKHFGKRHDNVLRDVDRLIREAGAHSSILGSEMFFTSSFVNDRNREYREFLMNRDGFSLLAMGFTGPKAFAWKLKYIEAFNQMEQALSAKEQSVMQAFNDAIALMESDKEIASTHAKALASWKKVRKGHIEAINEAHAKAQLILDFKP